MIDTTDELELLRRHDPAAGIEPDEGSPTADRLRAKATATGQEASPEARRGSPVPRRALVAVAFLTIVTGAAAVAQVGPFASEWEACHEAPSEAGREVPYPECAEFVSERVMAEVESEGTKFERSVLADGVVTRVEYDEAAGRTAACIENAYAAAGFDEVAVSAADSSWELGFRYGFQTIYPDGFDYDDLPWSDTGSSTEGHADDGRARPATRLTDEMIESDPSLRCPAEHFDRIDRLWEAQQIASQGQ